MDELQDAIEDAQYVNAIASLDDGPRPMLAWDFPNDEQLDTWRQQKLDEAKTLYKESCDAENQEGSTRSMSSGSVTEKKNSSVTLQTCDACLLGDNFLESMDYILGQPLGFFLFSQYLKDERKDYLRINFVEEVILYRRIRGEQNREAKARTIANTYLTVPLPAAEEIAKTESERVSGVSGTSAGASGASAGASGASAAVSGASAESEGEPQTGESGDVQYKQEAPPEEDRPSSSQIRAKGPPKKESMGSEGDFNNENELVIRAPPTSVYQVPSVKEIVEVDLSRPQVPRGKNEAERTAYNERIQLLVEENLDETCKKCLVGVDGPALVTCLKRALGGLPHMLQQQSSRVENVSEENGEHDGGDDGEEQEMHDAQDVQDEADASEIREEQKREVGDEDDEVDILYVDSDEEIGARDVFDVLEIVVVEGLKKRYWDDFLQSNLYRKLLNFWWFRDRKVVEEDFFLMRVLGRGGFGLVHACKKGTSGKLFAMKVMNKKRIKIKKSEQLTLSERKALAAVDSPFIVKLSYSFQSKNDIFLILDLMTGGDLGFHLHQKGRFSRKECMYFSARIMLGLQALHDRRYVYRDLKPENVLVADDGRVKLSDLGLATKITPTLHGAAGTRGYWAPEMLRRDSRGKRMPYGHTVDWFSFGCVLAEFISGVNPFRSEVALRFGLQEGMTSKEKAIDCATMKMDPKFDPAKYDHDSADLCRRLLEKDEKKRLGVDGCDEIMNHSWYRDLNWEAIVSDRMKPPFLPDKEVNAASQSEIGTFAEDRTFNETVMEQKDEEIYKTWDWTNAMGFDAEVIEFLIHERRLGVPLLPAEPLNSCCCTVL